MLQPIHIALAKDHATHIEDGRAIAVPFSAAPVSEFIGMTGLSYIAGEERGQVKNGVTTHFVGFSVDLHSVSDNQVVTPFLRFTS